MLLLLAHLLIYLPLKTIPCLPFLIAVIGTRYVFFFSIGSGFNLVFVDKSRNKIFCSEFKLQEPKITIHMFKFNVDCISLITISIFNSKTNELASKGKKNLVLGSICHPKII
jgi:hypothetical protein